MCSKINLQPVLSTCFESPSLHRRGGGGGANGTCIISLGTVNNDDLGAGGGGGGIWNMYNLTRYSKILEVGV